MGSAGSNHHVLFLIEDGPLHFDNRVRREVKALADAGFTCSVICPAPPSDPRHDLPPAHVRTYRPIQRGGHLLEYAWAFLAHKRAIRQIARQVGIPAAIHAANPPDFLFLLARPWRKFGTRFIFDQHDLCPELYLSRYSRIAGHRRILLTLLYYLEAASYRAADHVLVTNGSYRQIAISRGSLPPDRVTIVRNGPDLSRFPQNPSTTPPTPPHSVGYLGNMNPQDGVDFLLRAFHHIVHERRRVDVRGLLVGDGSAAPALRRMAHDLGIQDFVTFAGRLPDPEMISLLSSCTVCVQPDPKNPLNDISTMNKVMEYMALGKPVVAFDLVETRVSCGDCALYAVPNDPSSLGDNILSLIDNPPLAKQMGERGRARVIGQLAWPHQARRLLEVYERLLG